MAKPLLWLGVLFCGIGAAVIAVSAVITHMGLSASYNLGDPTKFQFILVPFWQIGLVVAVLGGACLLASRWLKKRRP